MAQACITNVNNRGVALAEYLKTTGRIEGWELTKGAKVCMEFSGTLTITFEDYLEIHPFRSRVERFEGKMKIEKQDFNRWIQLEMIKSLRGGEVVEYIPGERITIKSTEKTEMICIRLAPEEKKRVEEEAQKLGLTLSDYIRSRIL